MPFEESSLISIALHCQCKEQFMKVSYRAPCFACYPSNKELRLTLLGSERFYGRMLLALTTGFRAKGEAAQIRRRV